MKKFAKRRDHGLKWPISVMATGRDAGMRADSRPGYRAEGRFLGKASVYLQKLSQKG